jgi:hypothetical protein
MKWSGIREDGNQFGQRKKADACVHMQVSVRVCVRLYIRARLYVYACVSVYNVCVLIHVCARLCIHVLACVLQGLQRKAFSQAV